MTTRLYLLLPALLALAGCDSPLLRAPPPPLGAQLTGEQLQAALPGNSLVSTEETVPPLVIYFDGNGDIHGYRSNNYRDHGTWRIEGDTVCGAWRNWYGTMSNCWEVFRAGNRITIRRGEGDPRTVAATLVAGDQTRP